MSGLFAPPLVLGPGSPVDSAREFIHRCHTHAEVPTILHQSDCFYVWTGTHYVVRPEEEIRAEVYQFLDSACRLEGKDDTHKLVPFNPNRAKVRDVLEALAAEAQLSNEIRPPAWLNRNPDLPVAELMACQNGVLHLPTRQLYPHSPLLFTLNAVPYPYLETAEESPEWLKFLKSLWPNDQQAIDTLQEIFGLLLTADTRHQKAFLIVGPKRSGKGTIARILSALLGADNVVGPTLSGLAQNFGLAQLIGKPLAIIADARLRREDQQVIAERILTITGEDVLTIDRKFLAAWTGRLSTRFLLLTNELPNLADASGALASRFVVLLQTVSFFGREDQRLKDRLLNELPQILNWAIAGRERLATRGHFIQPSSSLQVIEQLEDLGSPVGAFLRECCIVDYGRCVECKRLYAAWTAWCHEQGRDRPGTAQSFAKQLRAAVPGLDTVQSRDDSGSRDRYFQGLDLDPDKEGR